MHKLILRNFYSPGDIVMLTAAVRDLHRCYPGRYVTDVRTSCPELWENNPYLTPLEETDPRVEVLDCTYPLINRCNATPYHCLHGFIEFLNERLGLQIRPTEFKGDIHLSAQEKAWYSQVHEVTSVDTPFWIIVSGGKYDVTVKWWAAERYQEVVDHFRGKIQFVQVGQWGHHQPKLDGVIDLRGQTHLRELVRLVYHAHGVLCPVTALMHLAAAVEYKADPARNRPCVVIAGGREPVHWEAYPDHQFIHTTGALRCCSSGGCWKDRVEPLGDGDERDHPDHRCVDVRNGLPHCMDLISAPEVIRRIEIYYQDGSLPYLSPSQVRQAKRGVAATADNDFDDQPLNLHSARRALQTRIQSLPDEPVQQSGRGILLCAGGVRYFTNAWVCINRLRQLGCRLPIELWHLGHDELDRKMRELIEPLGVQCVDALKVRRKHPCRILKGWELKPYALVHCSFREVLYLDADNVPVNNPEALFRAPEYRRTGAVFWPDYERVQKSKIIWDNCGLAHPDEPEFESGQMLLNKKRCGRALRLALWFNENSDFYYQHSHGDKETFHLAFRKLNQPYALVPTPIQPLPGTMCQHDFHGQRLFQHRNTAKWDLLGNNVAIPGFRHETECLNLLEELRRKWDGGMSRFGGRLKPLPALRPLRGRTPRLAACMITCPERKPLLYQTLRRLRATDWGREPVCIQTDRGRGRDRHLRMQRTSYLALRRCLQSRADYILFLEDDLDFNRFFRHNLLRWRPLREGRIILASLYNPGLQPAACDVANHAYLVDPNRIFGSQALLLARPVAEFVLRHWDTVDGLQDIKISRLSGQWGRPAYYHHPSLVQHLGEQSVWGGGYHRAHDFDSTWRR